VLAVSWDSVRLFLHVLAATVWVGGQLTLAALVPLLRRLGPEVPRAAASRFLKSSPGRSRSGVLVRA
jgi:putative copper export protein